MVSLQCGGRRFESVQAVLFDKDGTLARVEGYLSRVGQLRSHLIEQEVPGVGAALRRAWGMTGDRVHPAGLLAVGTRQENAIAAAAYIAETGIPWIEAVTIAQTAFVQADSRAGNKADQTPLIPGLDALLSQLAQTGLKLGIVSSDSQANIEAFVDAYGLRSHISVIVGAEIRPNKPHPAGFLHACAVLGVLPQQTLMVGDSDADMTMAQSAGSLGALGVQWGWEQPVTLNHAQEILVGPKEFKVLQLA
ncbi:HAD family hydrolase [Geitlerinema sp. PCC 7407]|uniref:HAD family hydrolase n=1 Tax=Geitlerinema sp. PCC 7407 TaxID=1173025 RepID=UPI00029F913E|nr:HAD family hydrolase [Geitlerinema sp. PCC 7407]AFY65618.1 HAD-superfamily hydrolase, subfamily IA, variant 1 [Geitlerinema sp. PCC 7407]